MILGFAGFAGSGKDTAASYFVAQHGFTKISFADSVKDVLSLIFSWDRTLLEGLTSESREWRNTVDVWWSDRLNIANFTPRKAMQLVGTDLFRDKFNNNIWVSSLEKKILNVSGDVVVPDVRFFNEMRLIKSLGGKIYGVHRGEKPSWFENAYIYNTSDQSSAEWQTAATCMESSGVHVSEYSWINNLLDSVIINDSSVTDLNNTLYSILQISI